MWRTPPYRRVVKTIESWRSLHHEIIREKSEVFTEKIFHRHTPWLQSKMLGNGVSGFTPKLLFNVSTNIFDNVLMILL